MADERPPFSFEPRDGRGAGGAQGGLGRQFLKLGIAVLLFAAVIARMRRFPRPRFEPDRTYAAGELRFGRVVLARPTESPGTLLGWAVVCRGREVLSRPGSSGLELIEGNDQALRVREIAAPGRIATVRAADCSVDWGRTP